MNQRTKPSLFRLLLAAAAVSLVAAACGSGDADSDAGPAEAPTEQPQPEPAAPEPATPAEPEPAAPAEPEPATPEASEPAEPEPAATEPIKIGMMVLVRVPALERVQGAIVAKLAEEGFIDGENITISNASADGDIATLSAIAQQFVNDEVDLIITTTTPALQAAFNASSDLPDPIPIVFSTVTDPVGAGVVDGLDDHPEWLSGSQLLPPLEQTFNVMSEVRPETARIGYLYNPAEANSVIQTEWIQEIAAERGLDLEIATVSNSSEVRTAAESIAGSGIDFFFYSQDSTVAQGATALVAVANEVAIPVITNDVGNMALGISLGVGASLAADGRRAGEIAAGHLAGELELATTPILPVEEFDLFVNLDAAAAQGLDVPASYTERAIPVSTS